MRKYVSTVQLVSQAFIEVERGFVVTFGFVKRDGKFQILFETGRWNDDLISQLREAWLRERSAEDEKHLRAV